MHGMPGQLMSLKIHQGTAGRSLKWLEASCDVSSLSPLLLLYCNILKLIVELKYDIQNQLYMDTFTITLLLLDIYLYYRIFFIYAVLHSKLYIPTHNQNNYF